MADGFEVCYLCRLRFVRQEGWRRFFEILVRRGGMAGELKILPANGYPDALPPEGGTPYPDANDRARTE